MTLKVGLELGLAGSLMGEDWAPRAPEDGRGHLGWYVVLARRLPQGQAPAAGTRPRPPSAATQSHHVPVPASPQQGLQTCSAPGAQALNKQTAT